MALSFQFNVGRLLAKGERVTTAKINAIVKGITGSLTGMVGTADLADAAVTPVKAANGAWWFALATLGGSTYGATFTPAVVSYVDGLVLAFKANTANTGVTNFDAGAGAKPLRKYAGQVLTAGDIAANGIVIVRYNTTLVAGGCWEVMSLLATATVLPDGYLTADAAGRAKMADDYLSPAKNLYGDVVLGTTGAVTIDWSLGETFSSVLTGNITLDFSNTKAGQAILVGVQQSAGGANTVTWTPTIRWRNGSTPVLTATANKRDWFSIVKRGTEFFGNATQNY